MPVLSTNEERQAHARAVTVLARWESLGLPPDQAADAYDFAFARAIGRPVAPPPFLRDATRLTAVIEAIGGSVRVYVAPVVSDFQSMAEVLQDMATRFAESLPAAMGRAFPDPPTGEAPGPRGANGPPGRVGGPPQNAPDAAHAGEGF